jgi:hypothetical protein
VLAVKLPYNLGLVIASVGGIVTGVLAENARKRDTASSCDQETEGEPQ